jgi:hypothetical protein
MLAQSHSREPWLWPAHNSNPCAWSWVHPILRTGIPAQALGQVRLDESSCGRKAGWLCLHWSVRQHQTYGCSLHAMQTRDWHRMITNARCGQRSLCHLPESGRPYGGKNNSRIVWTDATKGASYSGGKYLTLCLLTNCSISSFLLGTNQRANKPAARFSSRLS